MGTQLGKRILEGLRRCRMTQKQLANSLDLTYGAMSRYISGERTPRPEVLVSIAALLHTTVEDLLGIEPKEFSYPHVRVLLARNASKMSEEEKRELINAILGGE